MKNENRKYFDYLMIANLFVLFYFSTKIKECCDWGGQVNLFIKLFKLFFSSLILSIVGYFIICFYKIFKLKTFKINDLLIITIIMLLIIIVNILFSRTFVQS